MPRVAMLLTMLDEPYARLRARVDALRQTNWGELWPAWRSSWAVRDLDALHGGAIGHLRDLYRWTC